MPHQPTLKPGVRRGFTLVETALATVLVGGLFVVAMNMVGASRITESRFAEREQSLLLAEDLLQEILSLPYEDASDSGTAFGIEVGESTSARVSLDDADDFHQHVESPPTDRDGVAIPGTEGLTRSVMVQWVEMDNPDRTASSETGLKRVTVSVTRGGRAGVTLFGYVTANWPDARDMTEALP